MHPAVVECAVVAIPDEVVTNRIKAFVVTRKTLDGEELSRFCSGQVPRYMTPEVYEFRDELPRSSTGKIDRRALSTPSRPGD
jgi:L-proline---[L-prolyl-carrier protein] ligase